MHIYDLMLQISMSVLSKCTSVVTMQHALIPKEATIVPVSVDMKEMELTAQVGAHSCFCKLELQFLL